MVISKYYLMTIELLFFIFLKGQLISFTGKQAKYKLFIKDSNSKVFKCVIINERLNYKNLKELLFCFLKVEITIIIIDNEPILLLKSFVKI